MAKVPFPSPLSGIVITAPFAGSVPKVVPDPDDRTEEDDANGPKDDFAELLEE